MRTEKVRITRTSWYVSAFALAVIILGLIMVAAGSPIHHGQRLAGIFTGLVGLSVLAYVPLPLIRVQR